MVFVDRGCYDHLALQIADEAASQHICIAFWVVIIESESLVTDAKHRNLFAVD